MGVGPSSQYVKPSPSMAEAELAIKLSSAERRKLAQLDERTLRDAYRGLKVVKEVSVKGPEGRLDKVQFNEALCVFTAFGIPSFRSTPLGRRLFDLWDLCGSGSIGEDEFVGGLIVLCSGTKQQKCDMTFSCYDLDGDGFVSRDEFISIVTLSWLAAFRSLSESVLEAVNRRQSSIGISSGVFGVCDPSDPDAWHSRVRAFAESGIGRLRIQCNDEFDRLDKKFQNKLDREAFQDWACEERTVTSRINGYADHTVYLTFTSNSKEGSTYATI